MASLDTQRATRAAALEGIAAARFVFPSARQPAWETHVNFPEVQLGLQTKSGAWIVPDLAVTAEPGHFLQTLAVVALRGEVTEAEARDRWLPLSKAGALYLFVPSGQAAEANALCRQMKIRLAGLRTWRRSAAYGVMVEDAYAGPDLLRPIARLLPPALRPRAYRRRRGAVLQAR